MAGDTFRYKFKVLAHYDARTGENEPTITATFLAGRDDHLVYSGTLTMAEPEWDAFSSALTAALQDAVEIEDERPRPTSS